VADTSIIWTDKVWNPTTGCDRVGPGCDRCYALTMAKRLKGMGSAKYQTDGDPRTSGPGFGVAVHEDALTIPLRTKKPQRWFVNSMSDLFHPRVPAEFIARVFAVMAQTPHHTYQILTKRAPRMRHLIGRPGDGGDQLLATTTDEATARALYDAEWPLPNVWLGVSVEDQQRADERIPLLVETDAAVRWVSAEPLLGPVDMTRWLGKETVVGMTTTADGWENIDGPGIVWLVAGGESGRGFRPLDLDWARSLRNQCQGADVPFLFKQVGGPTPKSGGRLLDGREWSEYPVTPDPKEV
jgi:protein gp37